MSTLRALRALALTALATAALTLVGPTTAKAFPFNLTPLDPSDDYTGSYPNCQTCHIPIGGGSSCGSLTAPCLNPFGGWYRSFGWPAAGSADTDGDGPINSSEIGSTISYPGFPDNIWRPSGSGGSSATGACNPVTCAGTTAWTTCTSSSHLDCRRSGLSSGAYTLSYRCDPGFGPLNRSGTSTVTACPDILECSTGNPCNENFAANGCSERSAGYWNCSCGAGWRLTRNGDYTPPLTETCLDIDECAEGNPCLESV
ncbi:MAG: hypothetical protein AAF447_17680 [Myxococcota bacterium]